MSQYSINSLPYPNYFVRPAKKEDRLAIWQLRLNKPNLFYVWIYVTFSLVFFLFHILSLCYLLVTMILDTWEYIQIYGLELKFISFTLIFSLFFYG